MNDFRCKMIIVINAFFSNIVTLLTSGFVISKLWEYFIVPLGVLPVSFIHGVGIALLISFINFPTIYKISSQKENEKISTQDIFDKFITFMIYCGVILLYAFVINKFV